MGGSPRSPSTSYDSQLRAAPGKPRAGVLGAGVPAAGVPAAGMAGAKIPADEADSSAAAIRHLTRDHAPIARDMNDVTTGRLFAAGLELHIALGLIGDHRAVGTIHHAIGGLDQAIRELRNTAYDLCAREHHPPH